MIKTLLAVTAVTISSSTFAANCAKNPTHPSCGGSDTGGPAASMGTVSVLDGNNELIGKAFNVGYEFNRTYADVRLEATNNLNEPIGYSLRFWADGISAGFNSIVADLNNNNALSIWTNAGCGGAPTHLGRTNTIRLYPQLEPFLSSDYQTLQYQAIGTASASSLALVKLGSIQSVAGYALNNGGSACTGPYSYTGYQISEVISLPQGLIPPIQFVAD